MPTVPSNFVPQVGLAEGGNMPAFQAPGVQPMENPAAKQEIEFGQRTEELGNVAFRTGAYLQDAVDEANAKEIETQYLTASNDIVHGPQGYVRRVGKDAESSYAQADDALSTAAQAALDKAQNETQRRMLAPAIARNVVAVRTRMLDHRETETKRYLKDESSSRSDMYADIAVQTYSQRDKIGPDGKPVGQIQFAANMATALAEANKVADLMGLPEDSAQRTLIEQKVNTKVAVGIVNELIRTRQYNDAQSFLDNHSDFKNIDPGVLTKLHEQVDANRQRSVVEELSDNITRYNTLYAQSDTATYGKLPDGITSEKELAAAKAIGTEGMGLAPEKTPAQVLLKDALNTAEQIKDITVRKAVQSNIRANFAQREALQTQEYRDTIDGCENIMANPNASVADIPPEMWQKLTPKDRYAYMATTRQRNELKVTEELARNPAVLDREWLDAHRMHMTPQTYVHLLAEVNKPVKEREAKVHEVSLDAEQINSSLLDMGYKSLVTPTTDPDRARSLRLRENIKQSMDQRQIDLDRKLSYDEKQAIIDMHVRHAAKSAPTPTWGPFGMFGGNSTDLGPVTSQQPDMVFNAVETDENGKTRRVIDQEVIDTLRNKVSANNMTPTQSDVMRHWIRMGMPRTLAELNRSR